MYPSAVVYFCCVLLSVVGCSCVLLCVVVCQRGAEVSLQLCCVSRYSVGGGWLAGLPLPLHSVGIHGCLLVGGGGGAIVTSALTPPWRSADQHTHIMYRFHSSMVERPHSISGGPGSIPGRCSSIFAFGEKYWDVSTPILCTDSIAQWQSVNILLGGTRVRFPDDADQYLAFREKYWDVKYTLRPRTSSQPSSYWDIISHITITYRYIMYFFRTFKKSTAPYKVHNMGLRYIKFTNTSQILNQ